MHIKLDDLSHPQVHALLKEHMDDMVATSPPESRHALDLSGLQKPNILFWTLWEQEELLGCGALKLLNSAQGEIKSMRTARVHMGNGVGRTMLNHIIAEAKHRKIQQLLLETGSMAFFKPAHQLYLSAGFQTCEPFGDYIEDPNSIFMTKYLSA